MADLQREMSRLVSAFVRQIQGIARRAAVSMLESSMPRRRGRPAGIGAGKRSPADLDELAGRFAKFVKNNPGLRIEQINAKLGTTTKELVLPIHKLVKRGAVTTKGRVRSMTYYPGEE